MRPLFLDETSEESKTKEAGFTHRLSETPDNWGQEIGSELHRQLPFLSDYEVNVSLDKVDQGRGFAFGYADISNRTERPEVEHDEAGIPHIRVPIIAEERQVRPFSVFLDGERVLPLGEERIRETLFNPGMFDLSTSMPRDPSLVEPLMPPQRSGLGMGGEFKTASAEDAFVKESFKHISKEQWEAIYKSDKIQKMIQKHMTHDHPEVINEVYSLAANQFGYHPKVYPPSPGQQAQKAQAQTGAAGQAGGAAPAQKPAQKPAGAMKNASLLEAIAPTLRESDRDAFVEKVANDAHLRAGFRRSGIASVLVGVMDTKLASASDRLEALADSIEPTVVTFQKLPGGDFLVKSANVQAFAGGEQAQGQVVPFAEVAEAIGPEQARAMQPGQIATAVSDPVNADSSAESEMSSISEFGRYRVQGTDGKEREGWVFPQTFSWDADLSPQKTGLFISDNAHAIQQDFAGERVKAENINLPTDIPKGLGIFHSKNGESASAPIEVKFGLTGSDGVPKYVGVDSFGNEVKVSIVPGLKTPQKLTDDEYALPHGWGFTRLPSKVSLSEKSDSVGTQSKLKKEKTSAVLFYNGAFNIVGGCGLDKVAADLRHSIDAVGAEFMLGLLGIDGVSAKQKVAEARKMGSVTLTGLKTIVPLSERFQESVKTASALLAKIPNLKRDLIKEASQLEDQGTVDKVLALNFVNPENLTTFIEYLPELERCSENMAEMVLAGYMGMREIPVGAVERSMKNMEEVVQSLKALQYAQE